MGSSVVAGAQAATDGEHWSFPAGAAVAAGGASAW